MARHPAKPSAPVSNSELSRDVYGFTVRPHHFQRYKEYAVIYKEEEAERSARWERFLTNYSESVLPAEHGADSEDSRTEDDEPTGTARADGESKLETWEKIRPSLWPVERALFSRFKKKKKKTTVLENHESEEAAPPQTESSPQNCTVLSGDESEEEFYDVERSDTVQDGSQSLSEAPINNTEQEEEVCPWKDELDALVQGGVPMALRGELWQVFVGTRARRTKGHYQALLTLLADGGGDSDGVGGLYNGTSANYSLSDSGILEKWTSQIEKDLPRTFPGHPALDEDGRNALRRLLTAYARHNPDVGYCQAMNFFAALLLLMMPEENAFWTLAGFIDDYFEGYYSERMLESQVDQLVLEDLVRKHFPRLVSHLDTLGVQVAWVTGPWFLSVFVNILPWESVLRVWDVLLYEGNRSMLFRTALALLEQYGPKIMAAKDAGDAVTMLQSLAGSTFDSSQLVLVACMGYQSVDDSLLQELGSQKRPQVLAALSERSTMERSGWRSVSRTVSSKVYNHDMASNQLAERNIEKILGQTVPNGEASIKDDVDGNYKNLSHIDVLDEEEACVTDLIEQVKWLKVELSRALEESRAANLRADELETAFMELVKEDNRRLLSAKVETLEDELRHLKQVVSDKEKQEEAMVKVMLQMEQEQRLAEDARQYAEQEAAAQRNAASILQAKYESAIKSIAEMEKRAVMAESMLEATIQYQALGNGQVVSSKTGNDCTAAQEEASRWSWPRLSAKPVEPSPSSTGVSADGDFAKELVRSKSPDAQLAGSPQKQSLLSRRFSLGWRDKSKGKNDIPDVPLVSSPSVQSPTVQSDFSSTSLSPQNSLDELSAVSQDDTSRKIDTSTSKDTNGLI